MHIHYIIMRNIKVLHKKEKNYYENHCENKYIYYTSSWRGECVDIKGQETYW